MVDRATIAALEPGTTASPATGRRWTTSRPRSRPRCERYERFRDEPARAVWHAVRRALVSHLMIGPLTAAQLAALPWAPVAAAALGESPRAIVDRALAGLEQRGVVARGVPEWVTTLPHE